MKYIVFLLSLVIYVSIQNNISENDKDVDDIVKYVLSHINFNENLYNMLDKFVKSTELNKEHVHNTDTLKKALKEHLSGDKLYLSSVILVYLQNYFFYKDGKDSYALILSKINDYDPNILEKEKHALEIDVLLEKLLITDSIIQDKDNFNEKLKMRVMTINEKELELIWKYYNDRRGYKSKMNALQSFYNAVNKKSNVDLNKIEDKIFEFEKQYHINFDDRYFDFNVFKEQIIQVHDKKYENNLEKYEIVHRTYKTYILNKISKLKRTIFIDIIKSEKNPDFNKMTNALDDYLKIHEPIPDNLNEESFGNHLKKKEPTITSQIVSIIYIYYLNNKLLKDRQIKRNVITENNHNCASKTHMHNMQKFLDIYYNPPSANNEDNLFKVFSKIDPTFTAEHAKNIYKCYKYYLDMVERHKYKNIIKEKIHKNKNIQSVDLKQDFEIFIEKYELKYAKFNKPEEMRKAVTNFDPFFDIKAANIIYSYYDSFIEFKKLDDDRKNLVDKIITIPHIWDPDLSQKISNFIKGYFPDFSKDFIQKKDFMYILKNKFKVSNEEIDILYIYYSNHELMKKKRDVKETLRVAISDMDDSTNVVDIMKDINDFLDIYNIEPHLNFNKDQFNQYIEKQDGSSASVNENFFNIYKKYIKVQDSVSKLEILSHEIQKYRDKFSLFTDKFDDFLSSLGWDNVENLNSHTIEDDLNKIKTLVKAEKYESIKKSIDPYIQYKNRVLQRFELINYISKNLEAKSTEIKEPLNNFIKMYKLENMYIQNQKDFHTHLEKLDDGISMDDSKVIFYYYKKFKIMWHKQSIRDLLYEYLKTRRRFPKYQNSIYYNMFLEAYSIYSYSFNDKDELKTILEQQDDTIEINHVILIYRPLSMFILYLKRRNTLEKLYSFIMQKSDYNVLEISKYIKEFYDAYLLNYDLLIDKYKFEQHIINLDQYSETNKIDVIYTPILKYSLNSNRLNAFNSIYEFLKDHQKYSFLQITPYFEEILHLFNMESNKINNLEIFVDVIQDNINLITRENITFLYPHFLNFIFVKKYLLIKTILVDKIEKNKTIFHRELQRYIQPYIDILELSYIELSRYDIFSQKNKQYDESISKYEIDLIFEYVLKYIQSDSYIKNNELEENRKRNIEVQNRRKDDNSIAEPNNWYKFFKFFGLQPKYISNKNDESDLSYYQQIFNDIYNLFTGMKYYKFPTSEKMERLNSLLKSRTFEE